MDERVKNISALLSFFKTSGKLPLPSTSLAISKEMW